AAAQPPAGETTIVVKLTDYRFEPAEIVLEHDRPYRLHLENTGKDAHQFAAPVLLARAKVRDRSVLTSDGREVFVNPGQSRDLHRVARGRGSYELTCPAHDWEGMVGKVVVR